MVVDAPNVTYDGTALKNIQWSNSVLAVSTADGNPVNLSLYFFYNKASSTDKVPGNQFFGRRWAAGGSPPTDGNFMGQIGQSPDPSGQATASWWVQAIVTASLNLANGFSSMVLAHYAIKGLEALKEWKKTGSEKDKKAYDDAKKKADDAADAEERVAEVNVEANPGGEKSVPDPGPPGPGPQVRTVCWNR